MQETSEESQRRDPPRTHRQEVVKHTEQNNIIKVYYHWLTECLIQGNYLEYMLCIANWLARTSSWSGALVFSGFI